MGWFRRARGKGPKAPASEPAFPTQRGFYHTPSRDDVDNYTEDDESISHFRQPQYPQDNATREGKRESTLHLSPSEANLYLQALADLDAVNPAPLPLFTEPAPSLPQVLFHGPIQTPDIQYPTTPDIIPSLHPNRQNRQHGLLVLSGDASVQLSGFPTAVVPDVDAALRRWRLGVGYRSQTLDDIAKHHQEIPVSWRAELRGKVWRLKGTQENESVRLVLAIFAALARHGYTMAGAIQPSIAKSDSHNLLFTYAPDVEEVPPLFFALTLPQPDRISLINPPTRVTNEILAEIRNAITRLHVVPGEPKLTHFKAIKLEGWVHPGIYRFWMAGLRRWPVSAGVVKADHFASLQPRILLAIMTALASLKFKFVGSVPLLPRMAARDVLIFTSMPESGLCHRDAYMEAVGVEKKASLDPSNSTEGHTNGTSNGADRGRLMERPRPTPSKSHPGHGGSFSSTDFFPGSGSSTYAATRTSYAGSKTLRNRFDENNEHDAESVFSRPSARSSLERTGSRACMEDMNRMTGMTFGVNTSRPPIFNEERTPSPTSPGISPTATVPPILLPRGSFQSTVASPIMSPGSSLSIDSRHTSYNDFVYVKVANGTTTAVVPIISNSSPRVPQPPNTYFPPRRLSDGPVMAYPSLSPGPAAQSTEGHLPILLTDDDSISGHSHCSANAALPPSSPIEDDDWDPKPPGGLLSPSSESSSQFHTPPSSPPPRSRTRSPIPTAINSLLPPAPVVAGPETFSVPADSPLPKRSPDRAPPTAAVHNTQQTHPPGFMPLSEVKTDTPQNNDIAHGHRNLWKAHEENGKKISRDRAAMLSPGSVTSQDSRNSTTSSRPAGVGSSRTRVKLTITRE